MLTSPTTCQPLPTSSPGSSCLALTAYLQGAALLTTAKGNSESWLPRVGGK